MSSLLSLPPPKVSKEAFLGIGWGGTAVTFVFLLGRIYTRLRINKQLYIDDGFVIVAWFLLLANTIIWQIRADGFYELLDVGSGISKTIPKNFIQDTENNMRSLLAISIMAFSGLWFVKFCFLFFFRRLGSQLPGHRLHWWLVFGFTFLTWCSVFGLMPYKCLLGSFTYIVSNCVTGPDVDYQRSTLYYFVAVDVFSDALIISIPIHLLWKVKISMKQKLALVGIFSLTIFVMIVSIIRSAVVATYSSQPEQSWGYAWLSVEQAVAILIACLGSFRSLFTKHETQNRSSIGSLRSSIQQISTLPASIITLLGKASTSSTRSIRSSFSWGSQEKEKEISSFTTTRSSAVSSENSRHSTNSISVTYEFSSVSYPRDALNHYEPRAWPETVPNVF